MKLFLLPFSLMLVATVALAQTVQPQVIYSFNQPDGSSPQGKLVQGPDGSLYGTTYSGGLGSVGTIFKVTTNGVLTTLAYFDGGNGAYPVAALAFGSDGNLYGTCAGGANGNVFQVTTNGTVTAWFPFSGGNGSQPEGALTLGGDGNFYGTTVWGGGYDGGVGTAFKVTTNGSLTTLASFSYWNGYSPYAGLTLGNDGNFYGTTSSGGLNSGGGGSGSVFQLTTNGTLTELAVFTGGNGADPMAGLCLGNDGNFYGTTTGGGSKGHGTIFQVTTNGALATLVSFAGTNGASPQAALTLGNDGNFYGTTYSGGSSNMGTVFQVTTNGTLTTLVSFAGTNGAAPQAALTLGGDGNFYGTTTGGGSSGRGTVFQVKTNGTLRTLASFSPGNYSPQTGLCLGNDGNFYGTTSSGGTSGQGTLFQVTTNGALTTLVSFAGTNGAAPQAALAVGNDGNFYGTTYSGGNSNMGTVFQVTTNGTLTRLASFAGTNGAAPQAALALGNDGNFYGTTYSGGSSNMGTVFQVTTNGTLTTLISFAGTNGAAPQAALALGNDGNFYGTTYGGGSSNWGTIYQVTTSGTLTTLVSFTNYFAGGANPEAGLTLGNDGNFYGTTYNGGSPGGGTVFRVTTNGILTPLASFSAPSSGPQTGMTLGQDGNFYGITALGNGTIFKVTTNGTLTTLVYFTGTNGTSPKAPLTLGRNGNFYGITSSGGSSGVGEVFRLGNPPVILIQPASQSNPANNSATFTVLAVGGLPMSYQWMCNGTNLTDGGNFSGSSTPNLSLANVSGGNPLNNYAVVITNNYGAVTSSPIALIAIPVQPQNLTVPYGSPASFTVTATSTEPLGYQWYFDTSQMIASGTNTTLFIPSVSTNQTGSYFCVVTNMYGSATSQVATLTIGLPLTITSQPVSQTNLAGSNVTFSVAVSGTGPFTYQWQFNGINLPNNIITTVAGTGTKAYSGDGYPATNASLDWPIGVSFDPAGNLYIADDFNQRIRKVDAKGIITTVAGNGTNAGSPFGSYSGDGLAATNAGLDQPQCAVFDSFGNIFIADDWNNRVRKVDNHGTITTVAGNGSSAGIGMGSYSGDSGAATNAGLNNPANVAIDAAGNLYIADQQNNRIRKVDAYGIITTIAGTNSAGFSGDGGPATNAILHNPQGLCFDAVGNMFIADYGNSRVRKVDTNGIITTVAGTNSPGFSGDGGPATSASFNGLMSVAFDPAGNLYVADRLNERVREVHYAGFPALTLNSASATNAGNYSVIITSPYGSVTSSVVALTVVLPPQNFTAVVGPGGTGVQLQLTGAPLYPYILLSATNLTPPVIWQPVITNLTDTNGNWSFTDTNTPSTPARFYRATAQ